MKKIFLIGIKDVVLIFRDRAAITFMLLAPFLLIIGLGFITGRFGGSSSSGIEPIEVLIVNQDEGQLGEMLVKLFQSEELAELVHPTLSSSPEAARDRIDADEAAAAVIIPAGFTATLIPQGERPLSAEVVPIEVYQNPTRPVGAGMIQAIVEMFVSRAEIGRISGEVMIRQMLASGLIAPADVATLGAAINESLAQGASAEPLIRLQTSTSGDEQPPFNPMAYMSPGLALMFLMFTVSNGGRSILAEQMQGTLPRLLVSPTSSAQVLIGKIFGTYLTGVLQMLILILSSSLLFGIRWGDPFGVLILILVAVFGAVGWGMLITALARTPGQVSAVGSAMMLTFGILGGTFIQTGIMPIWFQWLSRITPNAWGLDGFTILGLGGTVVALGKPLLGLAVMGVILSAWSIFLFSRRSLLQR